MAVGLLVIALAGLLDIGQSLDIPEFQYPCYVDICTFPKQFCNSERFERRCSPCSKAVCREKQVPLACKYRCGQYENEAATTASTTQLPTKFSANSDSSALDRCFSSFIMLSYSAICTTIILVVLVLFLTRRSIRRMKRNRKVPQPRAIFAQQRAVPLQIEAPVARLLPDAESQRSRGQREPSVESLPPSYENSANGTARPGDRASPVQESHSGVNGARKQVCNGSAASVPFETNTSVPRKISARPINGNQTINKEEQPMSAQFVKNNLDRQNLRDNVRGYRSMGSETRTKMNNAATNTCDTNDRNVQQRNGEPEESDGEYCDDDNENTSLKS